MFNHIRKRLTLLYAASFLLFLLLFLVVLYFTLTNVMEQQRLDELETYFLQQQHDLLEHRRDHDVDDEKERTLISYNPNRLYFYYTYNTERHLIHGDESYDGLYKVMEPLFEDEQVSKASVHKIVWQGEHFLLLKKPMYVSDDVIGYIVVGQAITAQRHFFQKMVVIFIVVTAIFTVVIALLSYYLAGRAIVPIHESFEKQKKFVSDASHELRTPLSIFYSSVELMETDPDNQLSPFSKELIMDLKSESQLMESLLKELLFLARNDQKQVTFNKELIPLSAFLSKIGEKFMRTLKDTTLRLDIEEGVQFIGDVVRMEELLYILLDNAAQHTKQGCIDLRLQRAGSFIRIEVKDSGSGIQKEQIPYIFDRFYRGDVARKRTGTGLGLAIAKTIVEQHQGRIEVVSEVGKGTIFTIMLPTK